MFYIIIILLTCMSVVDCVETSVYESMCDRDRAIIDVFNKALVFFKNTKVKTITFKQFLIIVGEDDDTKQLILDHFKPRVKHGVAARINDFMFFDLVYAVVHRREVSHDSLFSVMMKNMVKKKKKTGKKKPKHVLSLKCEETLDELESLVESSVGSSVESLVESSDESSVESLVESSDESSVESSSNQPTKLL